MFEAKLKEGATLKKIFDAIKDLVTETSWDCNANGMALQAMDTSHVSLVAVQLKSEGFEYFRCDRGINLGMNLNNLTKILKCANNDDSITIKSPDESDKITLVFETKKQDEISEYQLKLMNLDCEYLGIPDTSYSVLIKMPSSKFQRICRDLAQIGDSIQISCTKEGVRFQASGDLGSGKVTVHQTASQDKKEETVSIQMSEPICLSFAVKYLNYFSKATPLSTQVCLSLAPDVPLVVEYKITGESEDDDEVDHGYIRYYLAPKIDEEAE